MSMASLSMMGGHHMCSFSIVHGVELSYRSQNENNESIRTPEGTVPTVARVALTRIGEKPWVATYTSGLVLF
jgi:hypothetical protein